MILQFIYKPILNYIYKKYTYKINERIKNVGIYFSFIIIFIIQFLTIYKLCDLLTSNVRDISIFLLMGIIIVLSVNNELNIIRWNKWIYFLYGGIALTILIAGFNHYMGPSYRVFPLTMLIVFMCLYYVWGCRRDYNFLFALMAKAYISFGVLLLVISFLLFPYYSENEHIYGYSIININPNGLAKLLLPVIFCSIYLMILYPLKKINILYACINGVAIYITYITQSRVGVICEIIVFFVGMIIYYRNVRHIRDDKNSNSVLKNCIKIILIICVAVIIASIFIQKITPYTSRVLYNIEEKERTYDDVIASKPNQLIPGSDAYKDAKVVWRGNWIIEDSPKLQELNQVTSGRISIWAAYFERISLTGHGDRMMKNGPHNQYIEFAYNTGILTGVAWLLFNMIVGCALVYRSIKYKQKYVSFSLLSFIVFFVISMLDTGTMPFTRGFIFVYYVALAPMFIKQQHNPGVSLT